MESIQGLMTPQLYGSLAARTGLPETRLRTGIATATTTIVNSLADKARDPRAMEDVVALIDRTPDLDDPSRILDDDSDIRTSGDSLLGVISRDRGGLLDRFSSSLGVGAGTARSLFSMVAGLVLGGLRRFSRSRNGIDASTLSTALLSEQSSLRGVMPVETPDVRERSYVRQREAAHVPRHVERGDRRKWLWLLALIPVVLLAVWLFNRRDRVDDDDTRRTPVVGERSTRPLVDEPATTAPAPEATPREPAVPDRAKPDPWAMQPAEPSEPQAMTPGDASTVAPSDEPQVAAPTPSEPVTPPSDEPQVAQPTMPSDPATPQPTAPSEPETTQPTTPSEPPQVAQPTTPSEPMAQPTTPSESTTPPADSTTPTAPQIAQPTTPDETTTEPATPTEDATAKQDFPAGSVEQQLATEVTSTEGKSEWVTLDAAKFDAGSAKITADAEEQLDHIATILEQNPQVKLEIGGYTSGPGSAALNKRLSQKRADAIKKALVAKGVDAKRLSAKGYGEADKVESTEDEAESNRRVAVRVIKR